MKGHYEGRAPGADDGGERVLLWATVVKTADRSNQVVHCAGEVFTPSAEAMSTAEPTAEELKTAVAAMETWERGEAARIQAEATQVATATAAAAEAKAAPTPVMAEVEVTSIAPGVIERFVAAMRRA